MAPARAAVELGASTAVLSTAQGRQARPPPSHVLARSGVRGRRDPAAWSILGVTCAIPGIGAGVMMQDRNWALGESRCVLQLTMLCN